LFVVGVATMVWHMFIVKRLSSAAFLMEKVTVLISVWCQLCSLYALVSYNALHLRSIMLLCNATPEHSSKSSDFDCNVLIPV